MENGNIKMESLTLAGREVPFVNGMPRHVDLKFYPENPRIYHIVCAGGSEPTQEEIQDILGRQDYVKQLVQAIEANGGLIDPLWVRTGDNTVFEGNSRLAAYRLLSEKDPIRWGRIKCRFLPKDTSGEAVFSLLSQYHVIGRKDWRPYEQAGMFWRRIQSPTVTPRSISKELGLSLGNVQRLIDVYSFMIRHKEYDPERWSFYDQYLKSRKIAKQRDSCPELDEVVVRKINSQEIKRAEDVRDKLTRIAAVGGKLLQEFITKQWSFERCYEKAKMQTQNDALYVSFQNFRIKVGDLDTKRELQKMDESRLGKCKYELKKIRASADKLLQI